MKLCLYSQVSDLIQTKKTLFEKLNNLVIKDEKHGMFENKSIDYVFKSLKRAGVDGLELIFPSFVSDTDIEKVQKIVTENKMPVLSIHQSNDSSFDISLDDIENLCETARKFSSKIIVLHIDSLKNQIFSNDFVEKLKHFQREYNVLFAIENMPKSIFTLGKSYTYKGDKFASVVNKTGLSMTLDTTHIGQVNEDICNFYQKNKKRITHIHLSDCKTSWLNQKLLLANDTHLPLGKGELPIANFLKILKKENYSGIITMEINASLNDLCSCAELIKKNIS